MKKILFTLNHVEPQNGVCSAIKSLSGALAEYGFDITVMPLFRFDPEYAATFDSRVKIEKCYGKYFRGMGKIVRVLPQKAVYKKFVRENYDIEVAFQCGCPTSMIAASTNKNSKKIAWMHGYEEMDLKQHREFDKIVACARSTAEKYKKVFSQPEKVTYLYNLVDEREILEKANDPVGIEKKYPITLVTAGRLSFEKGYDRLISAHARLMSEGLKHNLWIVGEGVERENLEKLIKEKGVEGSVTLVGFDPNPYKYMARADAFVCSSRSEGMSTVCVESLLVGTPIITTLVNGAEELCETGAGILTENDEKSLCEGMKDALTHPEKLAACRENIGKMPALRYADRLKAVVDFFENV